MGRLFRLVGTQVADALGYAYPADDDARVTAYLERVRALPDDATDF
jgi:aminoglycoside 6-adenylyltransferase